MIRTIAELRSTLAEQRGNRVALVSTMGTLHEGHRDLIRRAQEEADTVVVSLFRNPLRFRTAAERDAYPSTPELDAELLASWGIDIAFAPSADELLPHGTATTKVSAGDMGLRFEGRSRPGYFDGLLTVEAILFQLIRPDVAVYGMRDPQRVFLIKRMIRDLFLDVRIDTVDVVRDASGVPVSSRMGVLETPDASAAAGLARALEAATQNADRGIEWCIAAAQSTLMGEPRIQLDYLNVIDPETFQFPDDDYRGPALAIIAAVVDGHRFIDNAPIFVA